MKRFCSIRLIVVLVTLLTLFVTTVPCFGQGGRDYNARILTVSRWLDISGRWFNRVIIPFVDGDATPSIYSSNAFKTGNAAPTTITTFDNAIIGQQIAVLFGDANTTIDFSGTNLLGNGGTDWTANVNDVMAAVYDGTNWYCEVSNPSVISGDLTVTGSLTIGPGTKHDGYVVSDSSELQTTDATVDTLISVTLLEGNVYLIEAWVTAIQADETSAVYKIITGAKRTTAGSAVLFGSVISIITSEEEASWDCTFDASGNDIRVRVTGEAATTINWTCTEIFINGST